jgi:rhodanese-related sulfurtransferase
MKFLDMFVHVKSVTVDEARKTFNENPPGSYTLLDVREPEEYEAGHIPGAVLIPMSQLPDRVSELDPKKPVITY